MDKSRVESAVDDLVGSPATGKAAKPAANKAAKPAANKAPAAAAAKKPAAAAPAKAAKPVPSGPGPKAKPAAAAPKAKPAAASKPAPKAKAAAASSNGAKAARGEGKFYFSPEDREALGKELKQKVRKPTTTAEYGATHGVPTWKVRLAAVTAGLKLQKVGATLTMHPAK